MKPILSSHVKLTDQHPPLCGSPINYECLWGIGRNISKTVEKVGTLLIIFTQILLPNLSTPLPLKDIGRVSHVKEIIIITINVVAFVYMV